MFISSSLHMYPYVPYWKLTGFHHFDPFPPVQLGCPLAHRSRQTWAIADFCPRFWAPNCTNLLTLSARPSHAAHWCWLSLEEQLMSQK